MKTDTPRTIRLEDYRPPDYLIDAVNLDIKLDGANTRVSARLKIRQNEPSGRKPPPLRLDGEKLQLVRVRLDGKVLVQGKDYEITDTSMTVTTPPSKPFVLETVTALNPEVNTSLQGLYRSRGTYCTQCEAQGFRRITYFLDRPDVLSVYTVRIEADPNEAPILLSNGNLLERGNAGRGGHHYTVWRDPHPKPCYLFALVGGDLSAITSNFTTMSGRHVELGIYVERGKEDRAAWAMDCLKRAMRWDEKRFGREYDLDVFNIVAVSDFNMGAMENKGLNIFNDRLVLASAETASDTMFEAIESVIAHEYFHNWTGNRITCRDWFQLCLKEGLTVYRDQEFSGDERSAVVQRIRDVRQLRTHQFPEDAGPLAHPVRPSSYIEINNFYTATVYEKGAEVVRMIATILGAQDFRAGMDLYFDRHDGDAATIEDFLQCFSDASGRDLTQFKLWYEQAGTPQLVLSFKHDSARMEATLDVQQVVPRTPEQATKKPMHIPLRLGLVGRDGADMRLTCDKDGVIADGVLHVKERKQTFRFKDVKSRPVPSLLRGFSAPVNLVLEQSNRDLTFLLANDSDPFNRWQAANTFAIRMIVQRVNAMAKGKRSAAGMSFANALGSALADPNLDDAFRAELVKLPSQSDVAREIGRNVDPGLIWRAHQQLSRLVAKALEEQLLDIYAETQSTGKFSASATATGRRALRNGVLSLLCARGRDEDHKRAYDHFRKARSMTDQQSALYLLASADSKWRQKALNDFYERWKQDHVVIDTWFAVQAQSPRRATLGDMNELLNHPLFSLKTPNKVRALIGTFAMLNPLQFNRSDGLGYKFLADQVIAIDPVNPQIAARLLGAMRNWRSLEIGRRRKARRSLSQVAKTPNISRDVYEIVTKMLDA